MKQMQAFSCVNRHLCFWVKLPVFAEPQSAHRAILKINPGETAEFEVTFCSNKPLSVKAKMSVQVKDNQYSSAMIQVTGEAYQEVVSLDNIMSTHDVDVEEKDEGMKPKGFMKERKAWIRCITAVSRIWLDDSFSTKGNYELLDLGDCHVDHPHHRHFTMTNHSSNQALRFEWPPSGHHLHFSPQVKTIWHKQNNTLNGFGTLTWLPLYISVSIYYKKNMTNPNNNLILSFHFIRNLSALFYFSSFSCLCYYSC